jgi:hypothetical protein
VKSTVWLLNNAVLIDVFISPNPSYSPKDLGIFGEISEKDLGIFGENSEKDLGIFTQGFYNILFSNILHHHMLCVSVTLC